MPGLPTIANVYRIAFEWFGLSVLTPVNVWHLRTTDTDDVAEIAAAIGAAYDTITTGGPFVCLSSSLSVEQALVTPLDGVTAGTHQPLGTTVVGSKSGDYIPNQAMVMAFQTTQRGPRGRGRMYIGPIGESAVSDGAINTGDVSDTLEGFNQWHDAMRAGTPSLDPVVASYKHADAHSISGLRGDFIAGSQRRRLDQLR